MADLSYAIIGRQPTDNAVRVGTVTSVNPLTVNVQGTIIKNAGSMAFVAVGDTVSIVRQDQTWLVMGVVSPASANYGMLSGAVGYVNLDLTGATSRTQVFTGLFNFPKAPSAVFLNWNERPAGTTDWWAGANTFTKTGFTVTAYGPSAATATDVRIDYVALLGG